MIAVSNIILLRFRADLNKRLCSCNHVIVIFLECPFTPDTVNFVRYNTNNEVIQQLSIISMDGWTDR